MVYKYNIKNIAELLNMDNLHDIMNMVDYKDVLPNSMPIYSC